jgi:predicted SPOUT superfamily RNA methylase MTH1
LGLIVAIPDTSLADCSDLREKTLKAGIFARAFAVFRADKVVIFSSPPVQSNQKKDADLLFRLLKYMDVPQYLRKKLFPQTPWLRYAGLLPPLRTRSHPLNAEVSGLVKGELSWGFPVGAGKVDVGLERPLDYPAPVNEREPTLFRIAELHPRIQLEIVHRGDADLYWGFDVQSIEDLIQYLKGSEHATRIAFSRMAESFETLQAEIQSSVRKTRSVIALFGGPYQGLHEIFADKLKSLESNVEFWVNTIPDQGTETVRLEEALFASLALVNASTGSLISKPGFHI